MFEHELVVRDIGVQSADDVIAVLVGVGHFKIELVPGRFGEPDEI